MLFELHILQQRSERLQECVRRCGDLRPELETPAEECGNDGIDGNRFDIGGYAGGIRPLWRCVPTVGLERLRGIRLGGDAGVDDQVCLYRQLDDGEDDARLYAGSSIHCYHL